MGSTKDDHHEEQVWRFILKSSVICLVISVIFTVLIYVAPVENQTLNKAATTSLLTVDVLLLFAIVTSYRK